MNPTPARTSTSGNRAGPVAGVTILCSAASNAGYAVNAGTAAGWASERSLLAIKPAWWSVTGGRRPRRTAQRLCRAQTAADECDAD